MEYKLPHYKNFTQDFFEIAKQYNLNPDNLKIEFYTPRCQAILIEQVDSQIVKIHINLEENRIVAVQRLTVSNNESWDYFKGKYRQYMK